MRKRLIALIAGLLYPFAFAPYDLWPLALASIALFWFTLKDTRGRDAVLTGFSGLRDLQMLPVVPYRSIMHGLYHNVHRRQPDREF